MTWIAAGVASAAVTVKGIQAYKASRDKKKAKEEQDKLINNRPQYQIPGEYDENVKQAKGVQSMYDPLTKTNNLPGQAYMQSRIDNNAANSIAQGGMAGFSSPSQYVQLLAAANSGQREAHTDLAIQGAQNRQDNIGNYANATTNLQNANLQNAEQKQFQWNQNTFSPYASKVAQTTQMIKDFTQRQREREDSAIESGVAVGSMAGGAGAGMKSAGGAGSMASGRKASSVSLDNEAWNARGQGASISWQRRGKGY